MTIIDLAGPILEILSKYSENYGVISFITLVFALIIDQIIGDPELKFHPVMLIGKTLAFLKKKFRKGKKKRDIFSGIIIIFLVIFITFMIIWIILIVVLYIIAYILSALKDLVNQNNISILTISFIGISYGFILKWSFAIRNLKDVTFPILKNIQNNDLESARSKLSWIVRRDTKDLDKNLIISASVEVIAESSTDAATGVFFFYALGVCLGKYFVNMLQNILPLNPCLQPPLIYLFLLTPVPFAYVYRVINTADSVMGYKDEENINIGKFAARSDDVANYIPARLTAFYMILVGLFMRMHIKNAIRVLKEQHNRLESVNATWTMGTMAGLLGVIFEKRDYYKLGIYLRELEPRDIKKAYYNVMFSSILFGITIILLVIYLYR
ncbi:MAG: cobalamin biosynthesis protein [Promethearchaeota archaeon]